jgi:hypothetical protein
MEWWVYCGTGLFFCQFLPTTTAKPILGIKRSFTGGAASLAFQTNTALPAETIIFLYIGTALGAENHALFQDSTQLVHQARYFEGFGNDATHPELDEGANSFFRIVDLTTFPFRGVDS